MKTPDSFPEIFVKWNRELVLLLNLLHLARPNLPLSQLHALVTRDSPIFQAKTDPLRYGREGQ